MKRLAVICLVATLALPAHAQEAEDDNGAMSEGLDLMGRGAALLLEGLREEMQPMLDEIRPFMDEHLIPFTENLFGLIDDITAYEMPERLPNGDIIIRRRPDAPDLPEPGEGGEVEL